MLIERPFWFTTPPIAMAVDQVKAHQVLVLDGDSADFHLRAVGLTAAGFAVRLRRADESYFQTMDYVDGLNVEAASAAPFFLPIVPELRYPAGGQLVFDVRGIGNSGAATDAFRLVLQGCKKYSESSDASNIPSRRGRETPYWYAAEFTIDAGERLYNQQIRLPFRNKWFAIRTLTWAVNPFVGGGNPPADLRIRIKDQFDKFFMNDYIPIGFLFSFGNADLPGTPYPEIIVPANSGYAFDLQHGDSGEAGGPFNVQLVFGGVLFDA